MKEAQLARCRNPNLADVVERNICTLIDMRQEFERSKSLQDRAADALTALSGSMLFVYFHALWFAVWIGVNLGWLGIKRFDPFPFGLLTMIVSLEAIFLSTFVLVSQNRMSVVADKRADLDLQINLLSGTRDHPHPHPGRRHGPPHGHHGGPGCGAQGAGEGCRPGGRPGPD
jgi:uncharacterized membrane protein